MPENEAPAAVETPVEEVQETPDLGDAGKKAIAAERKRADALDKELKAFRLEAETRANAELSELERVKKENETLTKAQTEAAMKAIRLEVALEKGLPANLAARLVGDDRESIEADADALSELVGSTKPATPRVDPSQGTKPSGSSSDPAQIFAQFLKTSKGQ